MNLRATIIAFNLALSLQILGSLGLLLIGSFESIDQSSLWDALETCLYLFYSPAFWLFHLIVPPPTLPDIIYGFAAMLFSIVVYSIMVAVIIGLLVGQLRRNIKKRPIISN